MFFSFLWISPSTPTPPHPLPFIIQILLLAVASFARPDVLKLGTNCYDFKFATSNPISDTFVARFKPKFIYNPTII
jgi:hypothetical protein